VDSDGPSAGLEARLDTAPNRMVLHGPKSLLKREQPDGCSGRMLGLMPAIHLGVTELRF